jgi:N-formylglutamate amidohydrolase
MASEVHFSVERAEGEETAVVVEVPHAGLWVDPESLASLIAPARSIGRDADLYADELFSDAPRCGATLLRAHVSRYVCDLNRAPNELDEQTSPVGTLRSAPHGLIWRRTTEGRPALARPLPPGEVARRLQQIYEPYHATLRALLQEKRRKFGFAVLLCGHSMPTFGRLGERRADVVPGSRGGTTADAAVLGATERVAARFALRLEHDVPYRGGYSTATYGKPAEGVHAIQIELSRSLYMDEATLCRQEPGFATTRAFCREVITELGGLALNHAL